MKSVFKLAERNQFKYSQVVDITTEVPQRKYRLAFLSSHSIFLFYSKRLVSVLFLNSYRRGVRLTVSIVLI